MACLPEEFSVVLHIPDYLLAVFLDEAFPKYLVIAFQRPVTPLTLWPQVTQVVAGSPIGSHNIMPTVRGLFRLDRPAGVAGAIAIRCTADILADFAVELLLELVEPHFGEGAPHPANHAIRQSQQRKNTAVRMRPVMLPPSWILCAQPS